MDYAHQGIDLKPIPGIKDPYVDPAAIAKAEEAAKNGPQQAVDTSDRPPVLSSTTTRALRDIADVFHKAPAIVAPPEPETLSAL
jgi:penicillin-binding protein 1A